MKNKSMNLPNKLTLLRVLLIPVFLVCLMGNVFGQSSRYAALAVYLLASATDALDGYLARSQNLVTDFGIFMDPLADKLLACAALIAMMELGWVPGWAVIIIVSRELLITGFRAMAGAKQVVLAADFWGKVKTVAQTAMIVYIMLDISGAVFEIVGWVLICLAVLVTVISAVECIVRNFYIIEDM